MSGLTVRVGEVTIWLGSPTRFVLVLLVIAVLVVGSVEAVRETRRIRRERRLANTRERDRLNRDRRADAENPRY